MSLDDFALFLQLLAVVNVVSTTVLVIAAWRHRWPALEERATVAVILAVIAVGAAVLGLGRLHVLSIPSDVVLVMLALGLILISVPSVVWLVGFLAGTFDE
jgi:hypothetical protein